MDLRAEPDARDNLKQGFGSHAFGSFVDGFGSHFFCRDGNERTILSNVNVAPRRSEVASVEYLA